MSSLKIASWNINSIRARVPIVEKFLTEEAPDILCLQETKVRDSEFPHAMFHRMGYEHIIICGQPMHHGVAIASRLPMREDDRLDCRRTARRAMSGQARAGSARNVYVPPAANSDRELNPNSARSSTSSSG